MIGQKSLIRITPNDKKSSGFNNFTDFFEYHNI